MKAAVPNVPPPVGIVNVAPAAGQVNVPAPPLFVKFVVNVRPDTEPALPSTLTPFKVKAPDVLLSATAVVPIYVEEELGALSPVFVPEFVPVISDVKANVPFESFRV